MKRLFALLLLPFAAVAAAPALAKAAEPAFTSDRISVEVRGKGPDVVLIPGLSSSPEVWDSTVKALPGYRYHLVHVAGFAGKPAGANASGPVMAPVAAEIGRYMSAAKFARPALVGHSLGGAWAMMVASQHPDQVSKVMVVDMLPYMGAMFAQNPTPENVRPVAEQIRQGIAGATGEARKTQLEQTMANMIRTESFRPIALKHSLDSDPAASAQAMYDLITTDLRPELAKIKVPMTVLWARAPNAPVSDAQMAQFYKLSFANAPQAMLEQVPNSYHFIMWDEPAAFQAALKTFLAQ
ncbi:alpha/beta fold hydrolase [Sphingosinicella sp. BN140058]|uniref:alpha/beta fold hydrolase n=1 Tax=Sphingosinicella sp. BN140058 TaxID=1892855 RepID=UPI0010136FCA|nr:alpha/beta hydrolase [Sphingosinicella sp. BN140058]QAY75626.1 alpha/beta hydrolase [Sphingosinicella sp. BN140058]